LGGKKDKIKVMEIEMKCRFDEELEYLFRNELSEYIDRFYPKGVSKERGQAIVMITLFWLNSNFKPKISDFITNLTRKRKIYEKIHTL
jgi:hypothetical protein